MLASPPRPQGTADVNVIGPNEPKKTPESISRDNDGHEKCPGGLPAGQDAECFRYARIGTTSAAGRDSLQYFAHASINSRRLANKSPRR